MKSTIRTRRLLPFMAVLIFLAACQKEQSATLNEEIKSEPGGLMASGVVPTDEKKLERVPTIISADYLSKNLLMASRKKRGTTTGGSTDGTSGGTSGGTTDGSSGSGDTTVVEPPTTFLPSNFALQTPPAGYQGGEGSCVAFAVVYGARSVEQYYKTGASSYSYATNVFSPEFAYNQTKFFSSCASGTEPVTVLEFLMSKGACTWQSMPYSYSNGCSELPNSVQSAEAANYKIRGYSKLISSDQAGIKTMLINKHPVIFTCKLEQAVYDAQPGFIWKGYSGPTGIDHGMIIVGYDDTKHAYKVMNSWGTGWADGGYFWIDYDFFSQAAFYYSYVINL